MTMAFRSLPAARRLATPGMVPFAILYSLDSLAFATLIAVLPLQAKLLFGGDRNLSIVYTFVGMAGLVGVLLMPRLVRRLEVRVTYPTGAGVVMLGVGLIGIGTPVGFAIGMIVRALGSAATRVSLSLATLGYIRRREFTRSEPLKLLFG